MVDLVLLFLTFHSFFFKTIRSKKPETDSIKLFLGETLPTCHEKQECFQSIYIDLM